MDGCGSIPQQGYAEFSQRIRERVGDQRIPLSGSIEVTYRCNLRCQHCYIPCESRSGMTRREMPRQEIERILDEITDAGCLWLLMTGGEPFLRHDFLDIYKYAHDKGLILTIFTNGTLITPRIADFLAECRPFAMEITLYGATQLTYERVTGIEGSYKKCMRGLELLMERKLPFSLKTMLMTINQHELEQMKSLASKLRVQFRFDPILHPALDGSVRPTDLRLTPEEIIAIEKEDPDRSSRWSLQFHSERENPPIPDQRLYMCGAGKQSFHIDAMGRLCLCVSSRIPVYDLHSGNFQEGWKRFLPSVYDHQASTLFQCALCDLRRLCPQCPAMGELEFGDAEKKVEFLCQIAKLRQSAFE